MINLFDGTERNQADGVLVYYGKPDNFAFNTNIPDEDTYANRKKFFACENYLGAAQSILDYLLASDKSL